jgi:alpha-mannosidase
MKPILYILTNNHFDPTWRRCWQKRFTFQGETYASYADLQEYYLLDNLAIAADHPEYKFEAESVHVIESFLQRHPQRLGELQALSHAGRFAISGAGYLIIDANMVQGESLVRNYLYGLRWVERTFGQSTSIAVRNDAFGNSAQLPQILRGCELTWVTGLSYSYPKGFYWRGMDGSTLGLATPPIVGHLPQGNVKYAPCPACQGVGCERCNRRGIHQAGQPTDLPKDIDREQLAAFGVGLVLITPEELLPNPEIITWAENLRADYDVRFALAEDLLPHLRDWVEQLDNPPVSQLHGSFELNPNNSGVWVTRIRTKQTVRRQEFELFSTEWLAVMRSLQGEPYPRVETSAVWKTLHFSMFHDAITATHVDPAHAELQEVWKQTDSSIDCLRSRLLAELVKPVPGSLSVLNPCAYPSTQVARVVLPNDSLPLTLEDPVGNPVSLLSMQADTLGGVAIEFVANEVPALGALTYRLRTQPSFPREMSQSSDSFIENQRFYIQADEHGLSAVFDKLLGKTILQVEEYHPGELIIEHDEGSPWATLHSDQHRTPLAEHTRLISVEKGCGIQRLTFEIKSPFRAGFVANGFTAKMSVILVEGIQRVDFSLIVDWDTFNHRLRMAFPMPLSGKHIYEIPFGMLERQSYLPQFGWASANGDWVAANWAGIQAKEMSVAVFNQGTPSYLIEAGQRRGEIILISLLRSPAVPTYLHEPEFYSMTDYDGMRDAGQHIFNLAVSAYNEPFAASSVVQDGLEYNTPLLVVQGEAHLPELPRVTSANVRLAALKWTEDGNGLILRLVEFRGQVGEVEISAPAYVRSACRTNLMERQENPVEFKDGRIKLAAEPWEIVTLKLLIA